MDPTSCACDNDLEHVQAEILLQQAKAQTFIMTFCGALAGLTPVLLITLPYIAAWNGKTIPTTEQGIVNAILGGYALVLTAIFGASQKSKIQDALKALAGNK